MAKSNPNTRRTILVAGATGRQGGAAVRHLQQRSFPVRALTRDPDQPRARAIVGKGVAVVRGDFDDTGSLTNALDGVYGVFSVQNPAEAGVEGEVRQGKAFAAAAQRSRISHFIYSSAAGAGTITGVPHLDSKRRIEEYLQGLGMPYTILRPAFFMENWLAMAGRILSGSLELPLRPETRLQQIAVDDIGGIVAMAFEHPGNWQGRAFEIAGDEISMADMAALLERAVGREVRYVQVPWDEFEARAGSGIAQIYRWLEENGGTADIPQVRSAYPRLTTLANWVQRQNWQEAPAGIQAGLRR